MKNNLAGRLVASTILKLLFVFSLIVISIGSLTAANETDELFDMSFEDLMDVEIVTGNITGISKANIPVSVTTINREDIESSPARNLYDLMEIYVPGLIWMNHHDSPHFGVKGIISDRNYKFLLLVNGRNMNQKAHNGATSELENWDLGDIYKIEIVRGPGSVTYGPGAVAGIINISTLQTMSSGKSVQAKASYNPEYRSKGASLAYNYNKENINLFLYGSIYSMEGLEETKAYGFGNSNKEYGYFGEDILTNPAQDYFSDYNALPQMKFHAALNIKNWKLWGRYTSQGMSAYGAAGKSRPVIGVDSSGNSVFGEWINIKQNQSQHITFALENTHNFSDELSLSSQISWDSETFIRRMGWFEWYNEAFMPPDELFSDLGERDYIRNKLLDFSENELLFRSLINYDGNDNLKAAFGLEYSHNTWGPGWGKNASELLMGDNRNIISGPGSELYSYPEFRGVDSASAYYVGNGWSSYMYSLLGEIYYSFSDNLSIIVSGRYDKDQFSKHLFSPRMALVAKLNDKNIVKLVVQQSKRMNTSEQLLIQDREGNETEPETLSSLELIFSRYQSDDFMINLSSFYSILDVLSWDDSRKSTRKTGRLSLFGLEFEMLVKTRFLNMGINHTFTKQLDWELADGVQSSGISYSDYYQELDGSILVSTGNNLNNWPNHASKFYANYKMFDGKLMLHANARVFWAFEGAMDGLEMMRNAVEGNSEAEDIADLLDSFEDKDVYGIDFRINASITYKLYSNIKISAYAMNILGSGGNKRYTYEAGNKSQDRIFRGGFVEEPLTIGFSLQVSY